MKLKKILSGVIAAAIAASTIVVTPLLADATDNETAGNTYGPYTLNIDYDFPTDNVHQFALNLMNVSAPSSGDEFADEEYNWNYEFTDVQLKIDNAVVDTSSCNGYSIANMVKFAENWSGEETIAGLADAQSIQITFNLSDTYGSGEPTAYIRTMICDSSWAKSDKVVLLTPDTEEPTVEPTAEEPTVEPTTEEPDDPVTSDYALLSDKELVVTTAYEGYQIPVTAVAGDKITVTYKLNDSGDYHQLSFKHAGEGWPALTSPAYTNEWKCVDVSENGTFTFTLNAEDAANITANTFVVSGYSVTYTKVELNVDKKPADDPATSDYALLSDKELVVTTAYEGYQIPVTAVAGDKITVTYKLNDSGDYHQLSFKHAGEGWPALTSPAYTNEWKCVDVFENGTFTFTLNAEDAANITANTFVVSGYSVTYTKVELNVDKKPSDAPGYTGDSDFPVNTTVKQTTAVVDGKYNARFVQKVSEADLADAVKIVFTLNNGTVTKKAESQKYFSSLSANGDKIAADDGYVFISYTIKDIPDGVTVTCTNVEIIK